MSTPPTAIELRHLRYFLAVMDELHFGRAAERLHIAQPPLSQAIRKLEDELGVQLLHRTSRVVAPTEAGLAFAEEARKVLASYELAVVEARRAGGAGSVLRIGCVPYLPIERVNRFLGAVLDRYPSWQAEVTHLLAIEQAPRLVRGELDFGMFHFAGNPDEVQTEPVFPGEPLVLFLPKEHPLADKEALTPDDIRQEVLLMFKREVNPPLYDVMMARIEEAGYRFLDVDQVGGQHARDLMLATAAGRGLAVGVPSFDPGSEAADIVACRALDPQLYIPDTVVAWPANPPRQLRPVVATVRQVARELREAADHEQLTEPTAPGSAARPHRDETDIDGADTDIGPVGFRSIKRGWAGTP